MDLSRLNLEPHKLFHHLDEVVKWRDGECFFEAKEREWLYNEFGYTGDYSFIYFE